jgi:hypothetical protein
VGHDASQVHAPGGVLDDEQDMHPAQQHGVDVEEVRRQDRRGLRLQERRPGEPGPRRGGVDARVLEDPPDCRGRGRELIAQAGQLAVDAPVAPGRLSRAISSTSSRTDDAVRGRPGARGA